MSSEPTGVRAHLLPNGTWRVVRTRRPSSCRTDQSRWHERHEDRVGGGRCRDAFERRREALVSWDTMAAAPGSENVTTARPKRSATPGPSQEPPQSSPRRTPKGPITHDLDETRSQDIPWSLCGVLLYDPTQTAKGGEPATCRKWQRFRSAASYRKRQAAAKGGEEGDLTGRRPTAPAARSLRGGIIHRTGPDRNGEGSRLRNRPRRRGTDRHPHVRGSGPRGMAGDARASRTPRARAAATALSFF